MEILILGKTHMKDGECVGGIVLHNKRKVRLLNPGNKNQPQNSGFEVGQIWDIEFIPRNPIIPPHHEDIIVINKVYQRTICNITEYLCDNGLINFTGNIDVVFDNLLSWIPSGSGFIPTDNELPDYSTCFWQTDKDLVRQDEFAKVKYKYSASNGIRKLAYVGFQEPVELIPANAIVRLSLTRKFKSNSNDGFWLQLSGWYS